MWKLPPLKVPQNAKKTSLRSQRKSDQTDPEQRLLWVRSPAGSVKQQTSRLCIRGSFKERSWWVRRTINVKSRCFLPGMCIFIIWLFSFQFYVHYIIINIITISNVGRLTVLRIMHDPVSEASPRMVEAVKYSQRHIGGLNSQVAGDGGSGRSGQIPNADWTRSAEANGNWWRWLRWLDRNGGNPVLQSFSGCLWTPWNCR
jgi:hypothetical protein